MKDGKIEKTSPQPMRKLSSAPSWSRHVFYRREHVRTTWKFRFAVALLIAAAVWGSSRWWTAAVARSLVCDESRAPSEAILLENFDADYLLFERATELRRQGLASRVLVPVRVDANGQPNSVALGTAHVMAKIAHLDALEVVPIREVEPISLNAAMDVLRFIQREHIRSVIVVSPYFRSRRSELVYGATLGKAGIAIRCEHVQGTLSVDSWPNTMHGIQGVAEQWVKLQYYRFYVLPFHLRAAD